MGRKNGFSAEQVEQLEQLEMVRLTLVFETQRHF
jgi:hypothetical protein